MGDISPGSREAECEGGEDFYMAQSGKRADLLVSPRGEGGMKDVLFEVCGRDEHRVISPTVSSLLGRCKAPAQADKEQSKFPSKHSHSR